LLRALSRVGVFTAKDYVGFTNQMAGSEIYNIPPISTGKQKFGFGYQTVNDLYPDWILRIFQTLLIIRKC
jgi:hypothetical protein